MNFQWILDNHDIANGFHPTKSPRVACPRLRIPQAHGIGQAQATGTQLLQRGKGDLEERLGLGNLEYSVENTSIWWMIIGCSP